MQRIALLRTSLSALLFSRSFLVSRAFLFCGRLAFPLSLLRRPLRLLPLGDFLLVLSLPLLHVSRSLLLLGGVALPFSLSQRRLRLLAISRFLHATLSLSLLLFPASFLLIRDLTFAPNLFQRLVRPRSLGRFPLLPDLFLLPLRPVPLHAPVQLDQLASCLLEHGMGIDQLDSLARKRCDEAEADHKERSGKRQPDRADDLKRRFSHQIHVGGGNAPNA